MGPISPPWTLEAWVRCDPGPPKPVQVIIGGGEYTDHLPFDAQPLVIKDGRLHHPRGKITAANPFDDEWRHVALTCDGTATVLYLDGAEAGRSATAAAIIPGTIGWHTNSQTAFRGAIDELRIWNAALDLDTLRNWMGRPLEPSHPSFARLCGYYPLDDLDAETSVNWVGRGHLPCHVRNGRIDHKGQSRLAAATPNDNPRFSDGAGRRELFNAVVIHSEWDADAGAADDPILKVRAAVRNGDGRMRLTALELDLSGCTSLDDVRMVHVYRTGQRARAGSRERLSAAGLAPARRLRLELPADRAPDLSPGINYFLVTFDVAPNATPGNVLRATVPSLEIDGVRHIPEEGGAPLPKQVVSAPTNDGRVLRVLDWNIWHGGRHLGSEGPQRVAEVIAATRADIVTLQEAYGSQRLIADALDFHLLTPGQTANLAICSRWPLEKLPTTFSGFQSTLAAISPPRGRPLLVASWWLRYAHRPGYAAGQYYRPGHDTAGWAAEDHRLSAAEAAAILDQDVAPAMANRGHPTPAVIIGGDFNSGSDQDWTAATARWHGGYGPVPLPTSRLMRERGFHDTFRGLHADEAARPEGTFAAIYGHLQHSRIDYIYYGGEGIRPVAAKIVRTAHEIDFVWPSDHAAVVATFEAPSVDDDD